jgi:uncharacterized OB-fold protein
MIYPPMPEPTELSRPFWDGANEHRLVIFQCQDCSHHIHPPRPLCDVCLSWNVIPVDVSGRGVLYSYTLTPTAFHPFWVDKVPYVVALVDLDEEPGIRLMTNLVGCEEDALRVGLAVEVEFQELIPGFTIPAFRLAGPQPE